jgi:hypothetical protein
LLTKHKKIDGAIRILQRRQAYWLQIFKCAGCTVTEELGSTTDLQYNCDSSDLNVYMGFLPFLIIIVLVLLTPQGVANVLCHQ